MRKTHRQYLGKAVRLAVNTRASASIISLLQTAKSAKTQVYTLIHDIVSDARFFSITDSHDAFWYHYGAAAIARFIDSISEEVWADDARLTLAKEEFLNSWLLQNITPLTATERERKLEILRGVPTDEELDEDNDEVLWATDFTDSEQSPSAQNLTSELKDYYNGVGRGEAQGHTAEVEFLQSIPQSLVRLAELIGRASAFTSGGRRRFRYSGRSDIDGVTVGNDLNSVLPIELSLLATQSTQNIFYQRFAQKRLQIFSSASHISAKKEKPKYGPIYLCVDTSGSMTGEPERMAKMLALAVCIVAQRRKRPVILVNYSHAVSFFVLQNLNTQRVALLNFLAHSYSGGNDEDELFKFLFKSLPESPKYRKVVNQFDGADLLIISDFYWMNLRSDSLKLLKDNHAKGTKYYALSITEKLDFFDEPNEYLIECDQAFVYKNQEVTELKPIKNDENAS